MLGFFSLKISFVLDNTVETIAFEGVNINMDTMPTMTRLACKLQNAYRVNNTTCSPCGHMQFYSIVQK